ncbi:MAG TPA: pitrilysin family protein [Vicinamibacterales bacterium]
MTSAGTTAGLSPTRSVLPGGVVTIVQETSFSPAVSISASFRAGSVHEPAGRHGLAWFLGRVVDRGTTARSADAIAEALDDRGVALRVSTNRHVTTVSCTCLSEDFTEMLAVIADVAQNATFHEAEIDKRRAETITMIRQDADNPAVRASETLQSLLYGPGHPYGYPVKGSVETVECIGRGDLLSLHRARFAPSTLSLVVVGDVSAEEVRESAARAFGDWRVEPSPEGHVPPAPRPADRRLVTIDMPEKAQSDIAYGFTSITRLDPSYCSHWMMNTILGQFGLGGRIADNIRERQGMAYYAYSAFDPSRGPGPLVIRAGVDAQNVDRTIDAIDVEVRALALRGATERELAETRRYLIGSIPRMLENNPSIAAFLQTAEFFELGMDYDRRLPSMLDAVTLDDIHEAAASVLDPDRASIAVAGPHAAPQPPSR